jgi:leucyl aminopeptidase
VQFTGKSGAAEKQRSACVIVGVFEGRKLTEAAAGIDEVANGYIASVLRRGDLEGKVGQGLVLHNVPGTLADRVVLIGCGRERELDETQFRKAVAAAVAKVKETGAADAVIYLPELQLKGRDVRWKVRQTVEIVSDGLYRFDRMKSKKAEHRRVARRWVLNLRSRRDLEAGEAGIREGLAITHGVQIAKDLGNLPPNICTPSYLADQAKELGRGHRALR